MIEESENVNLKVQSVINEETSPKIETLSPITEEKTEISEQSVSKPEEEQPIIKTEEPIEKSEEEQPIIKTEEPIEKSEEPIEKSEEPIVKTEEKEEINQESMSIVVNASVKAESESSVVKPKHCCNIQ
jgi:hypothetical protein